MFPLSRFPLESVIVVQTLRSVEVCHSFSISLIASKARELFILNTPLLGSEAQTVFTVLTIAGVGISSFTSTVKLLEKLSSSSESSQVSVAVPTNILESTFLLNWVVCVRAGGV